MGYLGTAPYSSEIDRCEQSHVTSLASLLADEALLSLFSDIDAPVPPSRKGLRQFNLDVTDTMTQEYRSRLLAVSPSDIVEAAERYLAPAFVQRDWQKPCEGSSDVAVAVVGGTQSAADVREWHHVALET